MIHVVVLLFLALCAYGIYVVGRLGNIIEQRNLSIRLLLSEGDRQLALLARQDRLIVALEQTLAERPPAPSHRSIRATLVLFGHVLSTLN